LVLAAGIEMTDGGLESNAGTMRSLDAKGTGQAFALSKPDLHSG
jgi:hypothetical protein